MEDQRSYSEKLLDPRWQKKRLKIMQRDKFTCQGCKRKDKTLHVHHKSYIYGKDPWDYSDNVLITYCWTCHQIEERNKGRFNDLVYDLLMRGFNYGQLFDHSLKLTEEIFNG